MTTGYAELRRWWHKPRHPKDEMEIIGYVFNDPLAIWDDGEEATLIVKTLVDCGMFYMLMSTSSRPFKLMKDEEWKNG